MVTAQQRKLAAPSYIAAGSLIVFPIVDQLMQLVSTAKIHDPRWRFGAAGLLSNLLVLPVFGLMIVFILATALDHRLILRIVAIVSGLAALITLVVTGLFLLDAVQVRSMMNPQMMSSWAVASGTAVLKLIVAIVATAWFAVVGFGNSKAPKSAQRAAASSPLVMGGGSKAKPTPIAPTES